MARWILALALIPTLAHAGKYKNASGPFTTAPRVTSSSTDTGIKVESKGSMLKISGAPSGKSSLNSGMFGTVEISVAGKSGREQKGTVVTTRPGDKLRTVATSLQANGIGKVVKQDKHGAFYIQTKD